MALTYDYPDTYIINSVATADHETAEANALIDLGKQGVTDTYYLEKMTLCLVYIDLGTQQLEAEGMKERVEQYRKEYLRYSQMDNLYDATDGVVATDDGVYSGSIERGQYVGIT